MHVAYMLFLIEYSKKDFQMKICKKIVVSLLVVTGSCDVTKSVFSFKKQASTIQVQKPQVQEPQVQPVQISELQNSGDKGSEISSLARYGMLAAIATPVILTGWNLFKLRSMQNEMRELRKRQNIPAISLVEQVFVESGLFREGQPDSDSGQTFLEAQWMREDDAREIAKNLRALQEEVALISRVLKIKDAITKLEEEAAELQRTFAGLPTTMGIDKQSDC